MTLNWITITLTIYLFINLHSVQCNKHLEQVKTNRFQYSITEKMSWRILNLLDSDNQSDDSLNFIFVSHSLYAGQNFQNIEIPYDELPSLRKINGWENVEKTIIYINNMFKTFQEYLANHLEQRNRNTDRHLAETILYNAQPSMDGALENLFSYMIAHKAMYYRIMRQLTKDKEDLSESVQMAIYRIYSIVQAAELKGYVLIQFSWMVLQAYSIGDYFADSRIFKDKFDSKLRFSEKQIVRVLRRSVREYHRADPNDPIEGETYGKLTQLVQGYISHELTMNNGMGCDKECSDYSYQRIETCREGVYCLDQPICKNNLVRCDRIGPIVDVCLSDKNSSRLYDYVKSNDVEYGDSTSGCSGSSKTWKQIHYQRFTNEKCDYCLCYCSGAINSNAVNKIYLGEYTSNIVRNMVIVGVRFRIENQTLHLQIQEGVLGPFGTINESTVAWKPLATNIKDQSNTFQFNWQQSSMNLDDIKTNHSLSDRYAAYSVQFNLLANSHLSLSVGFVEIDYARGKIQTMNKFIERNNGNGEPRELLDFNTLNILTKNQPKSIVDSKRNQYITFTHSAKETDVAQTILPYIDIQDVSVKPFVPLNGIGLYHKGDQSTAGYVAPRIFTYDFTKHVHD